MEETLANELTKLSVAIADVAPEVWEIMIKQQINEGILEIIIAILATIGAIITCQICATLVTTNKSNDLKLLFRGIATIISVVFSLLLITVVGEGVMIILNPEYYAIMDLAKAAGLS